MTGCGRSVIVVTVLSGALCGCGWFGGKPEETAEQEVPVAIPVAQSDKLELNLKVGDRFPLLKSVAQELHQASVIGPADSRSRLELLLTITVEEVRPDRKRLGVKYNRVRYSQDIAGESFEFDSSRSGGTVPKAAIPYRGLVGNGFSFWIGPDNQVLEPVGFPEFLERCVRDVPVEERHEVLQQFTQTTADEGIANFVDDSIGLLPYEVDGKDRSSRVTEGDTWSRERRLMQPVPIYLKTRYTLRSLNQNVAEIEILGTVTPATAGDVSPAPQGVVPASARSTEPAAKPEKPQSALPQIVVRGGNAFGSCTIDRATGLPLRSQVQRFLDMTVRLPNGLAFEQRKRTTMTIQAFPQQAGGSVEAPAIRLSERPSHAAGASAAGGKEATPRRAPVRRAETGIRAAGVLRYKPASPVVMR